MLKIPTIFERGEKGKITPQLVVPMHELLAATATEKVDGTNVRLTVRNHELVRVEKRRNPTGQQKADGIVDPWYVEASVDDHADEHIWRAAYNTSLRFIEDGEWPGEAIGPKIQGNPLQLDDPMVFLFSHEETRETLEVETPMLDFTALADTLANTKSRLNPACYVEGFVWWSMGRPIGKIKMKDFGGVVR